MNIGQHERAIDAPLRPEYRWAINSLERYWPRGEELLVALPIARVVDFSSPSLIPEMREVVLPDWARDCGIDHRILVPDHLIGRAGMAEWERVDWWAVIFWYLSGHAERTYENKHKPILSYSRVLRGWNPAMWEAAWANRIALFLRRWASRLVDRHENECLGPLPEAEIFLTHDIDALEKSWPIRIKQSAHRAFHGLSLCARGGLSSGFAEIRSGVKYFAQSRSFWDFDLISELEERFGMRSSFFVYGGTPQRRLTVGDVLIDPSYDAQKSPLRDLLGALASRGHTIGLHQSFNSWRSARRMRSEKEYVESALGADITTCRQHWFHFSWKDTWAAQEAAELEEDHSLGFNDRSGFRTGAALRYQPWSPRWQAPLKISTIPTMLMDSHLFDYDTLSREKRTEKMRRLVAEVKAVRGQASIVWHTHVFGPDYGWGETYSELLEMIAA